MKNREKLLVTFPPYFREKDMISKIIINTNVARSNYKLWSMEAYHTLETWNVKQQNPQKSKEILCQKHLCEVEVTKVYKLCGVKLNQTQVVE